MPFMRYLSALLLTASAAVALTPARAETVFVKYRGPVKLDSFRCTDTSSSLVHRICYRADQQYLVVLLNGTYYHYCRMPRSVVSQWLAADSLGRFYRSQIKGNFDCRLGGVPAD